MNLWWLIGSGKTHTMLGSLANRVPGMYVLASQDIFTALQRVRLAWYSDFRGEMLCVFSVRFIVVMNLVVVVFLQFKAWVLAFADCCVILWDILWKTIWFAKRKAAFTCAGGCQAEHQYCWTYGVAHH